MYPTSLNTLNTSNFNSHSQNNPASNSRPLEDFMIEILLKQDSNSTQPSSEKRQWTELFKNESEQSHHVEISGQIYSDSGNFSPIKRQKTEDNTKHLEDSEAPKIGKGKLILPTGAVYDGEWKDGKPHGKGKAIKPDGLVYEGEWKDGKPHGKGTVVRANGTLYDGEWKDGNAHGNGKAIYTNGDVYDGEWKDGNPQGKACKPDGIVIHGE